MMHNATHTPDASSTQQSDTVQPDLLVVGAGMVGAALALGAARLGLHVTLIEQTKPQPWEADALPDLRVSAISLASISLLEKLNVWPSILAMRTCPYRHLETWEWEGASTRFSANELNIAELGHIVENRLIQLALWQALETEPNITLLCPQHIRHMHSTPAGWQITLDNQQMLQPRLLVGADGAHSHIRQQAHIGLTGWQYRQSCLLISIKTAQPQQDITWQKFYPTGPRAFLPLHGNYGSLVWYDSPSKIQQLAKLSPQQLHAQIKQAFPSRLDECEVIACGHFPLVRQHAQHYVLPGLAIIGDAAHTINPLAGQGVNLGFKDVQVLLEVLDSALAHQEDIASLKVLQRYERRRKPDNLLMQSGMDLFYTLFSNELKPVQLLRNLSLLVADKSGPLKRQALKYALGL